MLKLLLSLTFSVLLVNPLYAQEEGWHETDWSRHLAKTLQNASICEASLPDGSRVDIYEVGDKERIVWEVEWCSKWEESIGQSMFYYLSTKNDEIPHKVGIWLLKKTEDDEDYLRCLMVINELKSKGFPIYLRVQKVK